MVNHGLETKEQWQRLITLLDKQYGQEEQRVPKTSQH